MEPEEKVGIVKMKLFYALKRLCDEYSLGRLIGGVLSRFHRILQQIMQKSKEEKTETLNTGKEGRPLFGIDVLKDMGIGQNASGEYVNVKDEEEQEYDDEDELGI